jgi:hypothetical protein
MNSEQADQIWAIEIEVATVSTIWHQPELCAEFLRVCDPLVHLTQPHLRIILEAIGIAYGELNAADWATVVEVVRELGQFEEVGGLEGLNAVYSATEFNPDPVFRQRVSDPIFKDHVKLLQEYARHRQMDPPCPVHWFSGGKANLYLNKTKRQPTDPDYLGSAKVRGQNYRVRGWLGLDRQSVNLALDPH